MSISCSFSAQTEFSRFEVRWNGKRIEVPTSLYVDLFNLSLIRKTSPVFDQGVGLGVYRRGRRSVLLEI